MRRVAVGGGSGVRVGCASAGVAVPVALGDGLSVGVLVWAKACTVEYPSIKTNNAHPRNPPRARASVPTNNHPNAVLALDLGFLTGAARRRACLVIPDHRHIPQDTP